MSVINYNKKTIKDLTDWNNKTVLLRCDFNVPVSNQTIQDASRIERALPTIHYLLEQEVRIVLFSHLGRIKSLEDVTSGHKSLQIVADYLQKRLPNVKVVFEKNNIDPELKSKIAALPTKTVILLENTRYCDVNQAGELVKKESKNDPELAQFWASLGDVFVNDAFGTAHRSHASNVGIATYVATTAIGLLVERELKNLAKALNNPPKPVVAIFGGAKIQGKLETVQNISAIADYVLIGGGMSYGFLKAKGYEVGQSLTENSDLTTYLDLINALGDKLVLPKDVVCAESIDAEIKNTKTYPVASIPSNLAGFDIGKKTIKHYVKIIKNAKTVIWNGPVGVFENDAFANGTYKICKAIAKTTLKQLDYLSIIGGGDSAAAAVKYNFDKSFSHVSTGGGASLAYFAGWTLPGIAVIADLTSSAVATTSEQTTAATSSVTETSATAAEPDTDTTPKSSTTKAKASVSKSAKTTSKAKKQPAKKTSGKTKK